MFCLILERNIDMNEKLITEFWESSTGSVMPHDGKFSAGETRENIMTFAKMLIDECVIISRNADHDDNSVDFGHFAIMKHFGLD